MDTEFMKRLEAAVDSSGYYPRKAFAEAADISQTALSEYINGGSEPRMSAVVAIAKAARVNLQWLATGEGSPGRDLGLPEPLTVRFMPGDLNLIDQAIAVASSGKDRVEFVQCAAVAQAKRVLANHVAKPIGQLEAV
jgi:uncharacterized protein (DUF1778 family)